MFVPKNVSNRSYSSPSFFSATSGLIKANRRLFCRRLWQVELDFEIIHRLGPHYLAADAVIKVPRGDSTLSENDKDINGMNTTYCMFWKEYIVCCKIYESCLPKSSVSTPRYLKVQLINRNFFFAFATDDEHSSPFYNRWWWYGMLEIFCRQMTSEARVETFSLGSTLQRTSSGSS